MTKELIYKNDSGVRRTLLTESDAPNTVTVKTEVDVTGLVENNRVLAENQRQSATNKLVARVPLTIYEQSIHENWDESDWKRWLNDPDNVAFRVWKGNL